MGEAEQRALPETHFDSRDETRGESSGPHSIFYRAVDGGSYAFDVEHTRLVADVLMVDIACAFDVEQTRFAVGYGGS